MPESTANPVVEHRRIRRRPLKTGVAVSCRKGTLGLGPNLAVGLHNISEEGARLVLNAPAALREELEVSLTPPGMGRALIFTAVVYWCRQCPEGGFWVGVKFRRRLNYSDIFNLV
jgi:hypothetical protein